MLKFEEIKLPYSEVCKLLKKDFGETQYEIVEKIMQKHFHTLESAYTSTSDFACQWFTGNHKTHRNTFGTIVYDKNSKTRKLLEGLALSNDNQIVAYYSDKDDNSYFYKVYLPVTTYEPLTAL